MRTEEPKKIYLKDYQPTAYLIDKVNLVFKLHPAETEVVSTLSMRTNPASEVIGDLTLNGEALELLGVRLNGKALDPNAYTVTEQTLTLPSPGATFELEIRTRISPETNKRLEGLYRSAGLYCTQCEAEGFRRITYYLDRPDVLSVFTTRIEADAGEAPVLLSNGNEIESGDLEDGRHYAVWHDPHPKPAYLFALAAGNLTVTEDTFTTQSGRTVRLRIFVDPGAETQVGYAMDALKRSMAWDETAFGREYDLDDFMIVAVRSFNMGAMENKGLNIFNSSILLATPETATDDDYARIEGVIAHEYFHNWTGNRITCRDWFQLCLKEGLTVFRDQLFSADMRGAPVQRINDVLRLRAAQFPEDDGPLAHPPRPDSFIEIDNFYTATVYEKGAEICRMLHTVLGKDGFRRGMDCYFDRHDGQAVTVEDFVSAIGAGAGQDVSDFMNWYRRAGRPALKVTSAFDPDQKLFTLKFNQTHPKDGAASPLPIPVQFGLVGGDGADISPSLPPGVRQTAEGMLAVITGAEEALTFSLDEPPKAVSLLRGFSAPVTLKREQNDAEDLFLFAHDRDPFNRWQAGQRALTRFILSDGSGDTSDLAGAIERTLASQDLDPAMKALAVALPSVGELSQAFTGTHPGAPVDYAALWTARQGLRGQLATSLAGLWRDTYESMTSQISADVGAEAAGIRALANRSLGYLSANPEHGGSVAQAYDEAQTMTARLAALTFAVHDGHGEASRVLADFYSRFEKDPIVVDKWFRVQALSPRQGTLETVRKLLAHPAYDGTNPNRMRSVVMAYAMGNLPRFHAEAPGSYDLIADQVLTLDPLNPQIAARVLSCLETWPQLPPANREAAKAALTRVRAHEGLSSNVFEIADKCLAAQ